MLSDTEIIMNLSLIVPCYNEAANLGAFFEAATTCFDDTDLDYELVFVNDGSSDDTMKVLHRAIDSYRDDDASRSSNKTGSASFSIIEFSRNFGKESAMFAGLERACGDIVGFIDADMQQDPALALEMFEFLCEHPDYDCIAAVQKHRREGLLYRVFKGLFYRVFNGMGEMQVLAGASDFRLFTRQVANALTAMPEQYRFSKGLFAWVGFRTYALPYTANTRLHGESRWTFGKLFTYAWNGILAFSTWPLRLVLYFGLIMAVVTGVLLVIDLVQKTMFHSGLPDYMLLLYVTLLFGGIQMIVLGVFGEYMARTYIEAKNRPVYVARSTYESKADESAHADASEDREGMRSPAADESDAEHLARLALKAALQAQEAARIATGAARRASGSSRSAPSDDATARVASSDGDEFVFGGVHGR